MFTGEGLTMTSILGDVIFFMRKLKLLFLFSELHKLK